MNKKYILYAIATILIFVVGISTYINFTYEKELTDALKFKKEFEGYNNKTNSKDIKYITLKIDKKNNVKYSSYEEIFNIIKSGTGVIFLGNPEDNYSRSAIKVLLDVTKEDNIDTIYYLNISKDKDFYIVEDDKLVYSLDDEGNELKGTDEYHELLNLLDEHLTDYVLELNEKKYETHEKRIYEPTVIFVRDGSVLGIHTSTVISHTNSSKELSDKEYMELFNAYEDYIISMTSETCSTDKESGC